MTPNRPCRYLPLFCGSWGPVSDSGVSVGVGRGPVRSLSAQLPLPWGLVGVTPVTTERMLWALSPPFPLSRGTFCPWLGPRVECPLGSCKGGIVYLQAALCLRSGGPGGGLQRSGGTKNIVTSWRAQGQLPVAVACAHRDPELGSRVHGCCLEFFIIFKYGAGRFLFTLGPTSCVAGLPFSSF